MHFPTWAAARNVIRLEDATSAEDAAARMAPGVPGTAADHWFRAQGFRETNWPALPTKEVLDAVTGDTPAAVISKDFHAIWLNSAGIARTGGDLRKYDVPGGVVELGPDGEPTGLIREESAWRFKEDHLELSDSEYLDALREGLEVASSRGVTAIHDKDGWIPAIPRLWQELERDEALPLRVWQSVPAENVDRLGEIGIASGLGERVRVGYLKVFMDGTLGSQTALMTDGTGVEITSREELADILRRAAKARWPVAVHAIGDLANRNALDAFEETKDLVAAARATAPHRAHAVPDARGRAALRRARPDGVGAVLPRALRRGARAPLLGRPPRRRLLVPLAARRGHAADQRLGRADRGAAARGRGSSTASSATGARTSA